MKSNIVLVKARDRQLPMESLTLEQPLVKSLRTYGYVGIVISQQRSSKITEREIIWSSLLGFIISRILYVLVVIISNLKAGETPLLAHCIHISYHPGR